MNEISEFVKGRQSLDGDFIRKYFDNQYREELDKKIAKTDSKRVCWPEKNPVIGMVRL